MTCKEWLDDCRQKFEDQLQRADAVSAKIDEEAWNRPHPGGWSPAQIFEHLVLSNGPYLLMLAEAVPLAPAGEESPVRQTWFGKMLLKMAGPTGNAPTPKAFVPGPGPFSREVFDGWRSQQVRVIELCDLAKGRNIGATKVRNPLLKLAKMTLCDCFAIMADHTLRHVVQIEERAARRA